MGYKYDIPEENRIKLEKTHSDPVKANGAVTNEWTVNIKVPKTGVSSCEVMDNLPANWLNNVYEVDELVEGSLNVTCSEGDVYYTYELGKSSDNSDGKYNNQLRLVFYKDAAHTIPGITGGDSKTVTIKYRTKLNDNIDATGAGSDTLQP